MPSVTVATTLSRALVRLLLVVALTVPAGIAIGGQAEAAQRGRIVAKRTPYGFVIRGVNFQPGTRGKVVFVKRGRRGNVTVRGQRQVRTVRVGAKGRFRVKVRAAKRFEGRVRVRTRFAPRRTTLTVLRISKVTRTSGKKKTTTDTTNTSTDTTTSDTTTTDTSTVTTGLYGVDGTYAPLYDVYVPVGSLTQSLVEAHPTGTRFGIAPGVHRLTAPIRPRANQQFLGIPGAVVNGSKLVTSFTREGSYWVAGGQSQRFLQHGECSPGYTGCRLAEDVFLDNSPLWQVTDKAQLAPGRFFFDYANSRIYVADDPTGRKVEATVADAAFLGYQPDWTNAPGVTVRNLTIEKFGSPAQHGAIDSRHASGWIAVSNTVQLNHGAGISVSHGGRVVGNKVVRNGQLGLHGGRGVGTAFEGNEIAYNNWAGYAHGWEAGGTKWALSDGLVVRNNWSHHNHGPGLWTDIDNIRTTYEGNVVEDNLSAGIFHEISYDAVVRNNVVRRNGLGDAAWGYGAGIQISASQNVTVSGNVLEGNARGITLIMQNRGTGRYGLWETKNVTVSSNTIGAGNGDTGLYQDVGDLSYYTSKNNRFSGNSYVLTDLRPFHWMNGERTPTEWRNYGNDVDGTFQ